MLYMYVELHALLLFCGSSTHTFLKAARSAIHLAFDPEMTPSEYCKPSFIIAGWMPPVEKLVGKGEGGREGEGEGKGERGKERKRERGREGQRERGDLFVLCLVSVRCTCM